MDFLSKMQRNSDDQFDMNVFNKEWIETAGLNVLEAEINFS